MVPEHIEARSLNREARAELKTLSKENAEWVARHLAAASELLAEDPQLAHRHALAAARRAGRVAVVRETVAITAYETGDFALALRELRTYRRISGRNDQLPLMVDSERGVGRPDRALELGRSVDRTTLAAPVQVALAIAMSGARLDLEQPELALAELEIPQLDRTRAFSYSPALFSAYAEVLDELGRGVEASDWRALAAHAAEAIADPADAEVFEVYDIDEVEVEVEIEVEETDAPAEPALDADTVPEGSSEAAPEDALEPEVAELLAETEPASTEDGDGAVPQA
ncbi:hypothetical protein [Agromyces larvae]|uniref:TPR-repeat-containing protein n=1 Tax=Agromyces larvae TaxID=2929802 RepID=A0ABY4C000_9MICO|nr:hypothetical protein [Agromyces larvae]UOE44802.1 hypothetical protein MTO99_03155 [Agromyces larvae]